MKKSHDIILKITYDCATKDLILNNTVVRVKPTNKTICKRLLVAFLLFLLLIESCTPPVEVSLEPKTE